MPAFICTACGTQYPPAEAPPDACPVCEDERQFVPPAGQEWTTLEQMRGRYLNAWRRYEDGLYGIGTQPTFAIGQRALLIRTPQGNVLWDCFTFLDAATVDLVRALGGLTAIAISHPHYYTTMVEWAHAFDVPVWLHAADRDHVKRSDPALKFWFGATHTLLGDLTLINTPGHYDGGTVLHWAGGAEGRGVLLSGDMLQVSPDRKTVSFMRSYPNFLPLGPAAVRRIGDAVAPFAFDRVYGVFWDRVIATGGKDAVMYSVDRALRWLAN